MFFVDRTQLHRKIRCNRICLLIHYTNHIGSRMVNMNVDLLQFRSNGSEICFLQMRIDVSIMWMNPRMLLEQFQYLSIQVLVLHLCLLGTFPVVPIGRVPTIRNPQSKCIDAVLVVGDNQNLRFLFLGYDLTETFYAFVDRIEFCVPNGTRTKFITECRVLSCLDIQ